MRRIKICELKEGDILAEHILYGNSNVLLSRGTALSEKTIKELTKRLGSDNSVLIETESLFDENSDDIFSDDSKIQGLFNDLEDDENSENQEPNNEEIQQPDKNITPSQKGFDAIPKDKAFQDTKKVIDENYEILVDSYKNFAQSLYLDDQSFYQVGKNFATSFLSENVDFNPALAYITQLEAWDQNTFAHSINVALLSLMIANQQTSDINVLISVCLSGLLHDIGKLFLDIEGVVDMDYLVHKPGRFTDTEFDQMKKHVDVTNYFEGKLSFLPPEERKNVIYGIIDHHERFDGSGYLKGKKGNQISYFGRIIAISDVYDALTRERAYKKIIHPHKAMKIMIAESLQGYYDKTLFKIFYKIMGLYPTGAVVETNLGRAVVVKQNPHTPKRPYIKLLDSNDAEIINTNNEKKLVITDSKIDPTV